MLNFFFAIIICWLLLFVRKEGTQLISQKGSFWHQQISIKDHIMNENAFIFSQITVVLTTAGMLWGFPPPTLSVVDKFQHFGSGNLWGRCCTCRISGCLCASPVFAALSEPSTSAEVMAGFPLAPVLAIQSVSSMLWNSKTVNICTGLPQVRCLRKKFLTMSMRP